MTETTTKRSMPKSYLTDAEREEALATMGENAMYLVESGAATDADDDDAAWSWLALAKLPTHTFKSIKRWHGADFIREKGFDTSEADAEFGEGWLDEPIEPLC